MSTDQKERIMVDEPQPFVAFEAYNPLTDEAPAGGGEDCDGVDHEGQS